MKKFLLALFLLSAAAGTMAQNVGVDINIGGPGYYGTIQLGDFGRPPVIYAQPIIIERSVHYSNAPMYLRVPPGHAKKWSKHCRSYNACGRPVYFVQDSWYNNTYAPHYRRTHGGGGRADSDRHHDGRDFRLDDHGYKDKGHKDKGHKDKGHKDKGHKDKDHKDKDHGKH